MAVLFLLIAPFSLCGAEMSQEDPRKEAERKEVQRLLEPYVKSGFAGEAAASSDDCRILEEDAGEIPNFPSDKANSPSGPSPLPSPAGGEGERPKSPR